MNSLNDIHLQTVTSHNKKPVSASVYESHAKFIRQQVKQMSQAVGWHLLIATVMEVCVGVPQAIN